MKTVAQFGLVALIALLFTVLPGGGAALDVAGSLLTIAFLAAIAFVGYRAFRDYRFELSSLDRNQRLALYGSLGGAMLTFTATSRLFDAGGGGVLLWLALLGLCSYGLFWVWTSYRRVA